MSVQKYVSLAPPKNNYPFPSGMFRQAGALSSLGSNGQFSMYIANNNFAVPYASSPMLFYVAATYSGTSPITPFAFFNVLYAEGNTFGQRTSGSQKGSLYFTTSATGTLGSFGYGLVAQSNILPTPAPTAPNVDASIIPNLLVIDTTYYTVPSPLITPVVPGVTYGLFTVDGVALSAGERVFAQNSFDAVKSGIYIASSGFWPRASDMSDGSDASGAYFNVLNGTQYANTNWLCTNTAGNGIVGVNQLYFNSF